MAGLDEIKALITTPELPGLGPGPRAGIQPQTVLNCKLDDCLGKSRIHRQNQQLIRALVLLWHDHLDAAHVIAQNIDTTDGAFVHGIVHRREPDYENAKYWFRRVGKHPSFSAIGQRVATLLDGRDNPELSELLAPDGQWHASAFVDCCERGTRNESVLSEIQKVETEVLLLQFWDTTDR